MKHNLVQTSGNNRLGLGTASSVSLSVAAQTSPLLLSLPEGLLVLFPRCVPEILIFCLSPSTLGDLGSETCRTEYLEIMTTMKDFIKFPFARQRLLSAALGENSTLRSCPLAFAMGQLTSSGSWTESCMTAWTFPKLILMITLLINLSIPGCPEFPQCAASDMDQAA